MTPRRFSWLLVLLVAAALLIIPPNHSLARKAVPASPSAGQLPFGPNEELEFEGEFSRLLLRGVNIANLTFRVSMPTGPGQTTPETQMFRVSAEVLSKGLVTKIFGLKFRELVDSTVAVEPFGAQTTVKVDEQGKRLRTSETVFDTAAGKVTYTERDPNEPNKPPRVVTAPLAGAVQDIASVFYYLRTQKLEPGKTITVQVSDSGQVYAMAVKISEGKKLKTVIGKVNTIKLEPDMFGEGKMVRNNATLVIWMTDDARHIPVQAQIKAQIGTVDIKLKRASLGK
jgi:hypothetical protein